MLAETVKDCYCVSIIGMCKNAGKTTALNRLVAELQACGGTLALTSVGRDGESTDVVTGTPKPRIRVLEGALIATAEKLLPLCDISREIVDTTGITTPLGRVVIARARSDGDVQLAGPSIVSQIAGLSESFRALGADKLVVDGALGRKSTASTALAEAVILSTGASLGRDMRAVAAETGFVYKIMTLPGTAQPTPEFADGEKFCAVSDGGATCLRDIDALEDYVRTGALWQALFVDGAMTDAVADRLVRGGLLPEGAELIVGDSSRLLLDEESFRRLEQRGACVRVAHPIRVAAVTVNPVSAYGWRFDAAEFRQAVADAIDAPVFDVEV